MYNVSITKSTYQLEMFDELPSSHCHFDSLTVTMETINNAANKLSHIMHYYKLLVLRELS